MPGMFGVFYYRSANPRTLATLEQLPAGAGRRADSGVRRRQHARRDLRAHIRELREAGARHFYVSNLPLQRAAVTLNRILTLASAPAEPSGG